MYRLKKKKINVVPYWVESYIFSSATWREVQKYETVHSASVVEFFFSFFLLIIEVNTFALSFCYLTVYWPVLFCTRCTQLRWAGRSSTLMSGINVFVSKELSINLKLFLLKRKERFGPFWLKRDGRSSCLCSTEL